MKQRVIYIFTHDSIGLGEDGPTHQPIEHLAMLRAIPNLNVFRPCDAEETIIAFEQALNSQDSPSAIVLTRQNLDFLIKEDLQNANKNRGAYIISDARNSEKPDAIIFATGSEVATSLLAKEKLLAQNIDVRVVSVPCFEIFDKQDEIYKRQILGEKNILKVAVEAAISQGWHRYIGCDGIFIGMSTFGASAKAEDLYKYFNITPDYIAKQVIEKLQK